MDLLEEAYSNAIKVLKLNSTKYGFKASYNYYNQVWARDGSITILGALLTKDNKLIQTSKKTLQTLLKFQTNLGQIPNAVFLKNLEKSYYSVDANAWFIIAFYEYWKATNDDKFLKENFLKLKKAVDWLSYREIDDSHLITSPPAADWMDSSIQRVGKVFYNNCLYYASLKFFNEICEYCKEEGTKAEIVKRNINIVFWPSSKGEKLLPLTWEKAFYKEMINPYREHYLNYLSYENYDSRFDTLANCLSIIWGIADKRKSKLILNYIKRKRLSEPFPIKVLNPPIIYPNPSWNPKVDLYRKEQNRNKPFCYHNAGIWPYVGGFYIKALNRFGKNKEVKKELEKLALGCKKGNWEFNEWLHAKTGEPKGAKYQAWSAAGYLIAYHSKKY